MRIQRGLFDDPPPRPDPVALEVKRSRRQTLDERFAAYHEAHPEVYELFRRFALQLWEAGRRKGGAKAVAERIRWEQAIRGVPDDEFKLNNNYVSRYARMLAGELPQFKTFFEFRELKSRKEQQP